METDDILGTLRNAPIDSDGDESVLKPDIMQGVGSISGFIRNLPLGVVGTLPYFVDERPRQSLDEIYQIMEAIDKMAKERYGIKK